MKRETLTGERLDKAYKRYLGYYDMYAKGSRMNEAKLSKGEFQTQHWDFSRAGTPTERKNIARAIASSQRAVQGLNSARHYQELFKEAGYDYTLKEIRKMDWTAKYKQDYPDSFFGASASQAQSLFFIASELGYEEDYVYAEE